jgi:hypothetical protein
MGMSDRITFERVRFLMKEKGIISCEKQWEVRGIPIMSPDTEVKVKREILSDITSDELGIMLYIKLLTFSEMLK